MFSWSLEAETYGRAAGNTLPSTSVSRDSTLTKPTLSFFAAASAAFALGSLVQRTNDSRSSSFENGSVTPSNSHPTLDHDPSTSPAALLVLSEQSLAIFERSYSYDLDYMVAMILQVIYLLHDGRLSLPHTILPLVSTLKTSYFDGNLHGIRSGKW